MRKLLLIVLIIIGLVSLFTLNTSWFNFFKSDSKLDVLESTKKIKIDTRSINVTIIPKKQSYIEAKVVGKGSVDVVRKGNIIEVEYSKKWFESFFSFADRSKMTIMIPKDYQNDIEFEIGSGHVNFPNSSELAFNNFSIELGSGNIELGEVTAKSGNFEIGSGNTTIKKFMGEVEADVSSGKLTIHNMNGKLKADVSSGQLSVKVEELANSITAKVSSGYLRLDLPEDADFSLKSRVSSGSFHNEFPLKNEVRTKNTIEGTHGKGTHNLNLEVSSGAINLNK